MAPVGAHALYICVCAESEGGEEVGRAEVRERVNMRDYRSDSEVVGGRWLAVEERSPLRNLSSLSLTQSKDSASAEFTKVLTAVKSEMGSGGGFHKVSEKFGS